MYSVFSLIMAMLCAGLFVLNCVHGTTLGLISTGGLAVLSGWRVYRSRGSRRPAKDRHA